MPEAATETTTPPGDLSAADTGVSPEHAGTLPEDIGYGTVVGEPDWQWVDGKTASEIIGKSERTLRDWATKGKLKRRYDDEGHVLYFVAVDDRTTQVTSGEHDETAGSSPADASREGGNGTGSLPEVLRQIADERDYLRCQNEELLRQLSGKDRQLADKDAELRDTRQRLDMMTGMVLNYLRQLPESAGSVGDNGSGGDEHSAYRDATPSTAHEREITIRGAKPKRWYQFWR